MPRKYLKLGHYRFILHPSYFIIVTILKWLYTGFGLIIGFLEHLQNVTTNKDYVITVLDIPQITVTTTHIKSSQFSMSSPVVAWRRIPIMSSASVLTFLLTGDCLTTNSLLQLACLGTDRTENTVFLLLFLLTAVQTCLFAKQLLSNGCCIATSFVVIA
jgi:hypothetical protein